MARQRKGPGGRKSSSQPVTIHELEIVLAKTKPKIWRRFEVRSDSTLGELHGVIQTVMGWLGCHLHEFIDRDDNRYAPFNEEMDDDWNAEVIGEDEVVLHDVMPEKGSRLVYEYDFGDGWLHHLRVIAIRPAEAGARYPRCLAGERACPPEDSGGVYGYYEMLGILADPEHEEYEDYREWIADDFDPDAFDLDETNMLLKALH